MTFVRRDIWLLERPQPWHDTTLWYARAVGTLRRTALPGHADLSVWTYLAAMHGTTCRPNRPLWNECRHGSWHFLPWHRLYLYYFESTVRSTIVAAGGPADWALPYWDYSRVGDSDSIPIAFREPLLPDGQAGNPLFLQQRAPGINDGLRLDPRITSVSAAGKAATNFSPPPLPGFGGGPTVDDHFWEATGYVEQTPHNDVHNALGGEFGGWMASSQLAALDPIFWLHHANIDRLWSLWASQNGNPTDQAWLTKAFTFLDQNAQQVTRTITDVLDTETQLSYTYEPLPQQPPSGLAAQPVAPIGGWQAVPELLGASDQQVVLTGQPVAVDITIDAPPIVGLNAENASQRLYLSVENLAADRPPGKVYAVYVTVPDAGSEPQYVGNISLFGAGESDHPADGPHGERRLFDVTDAVAPFIGKAPTSQVRVHFEPIGLVNDQPPSVAADVTAAASKTPPLRIGQVSIFSE